MTPQEAAEKLRGLGFKVTVDSDYQFFSSLDLCWVVVGVDGKILRYSDAGLIQLAEREGE